MCDPVSQDTDPAGRKAPHSPARTPSTTTGPAAAAQSDARPRRRYTLPPAGQPRYPNPRRFGPQPVPAHVKAGLPARPATAPRPVGTAPVTAMTTAHVQPWVNARRAAADLTHNSIGKYHVVLHGIFARAVADRIINLNPYAATVLPKVDRPQALAGPSSVRASSTGSWRASVPGGSTWS